MSNIDETTLTGDRLEEITMTTGTLNGGYSFIMAGEGKITIDWGDGTNETFTLTEKDKTYSHKYKEEAAYKIVVTSDNSTIIEYLDLCGCLLTSLDISDKCRLKYLDCGSNLLKTLDTSRNHKLEKLAFQDNKFTSFDASQNTALKYLVCTANEFTAAAIDVLFETLHNKGGTVCIELNPGTDDCNRTIAEKKGWEVID